MAIRKLIVLLCISIFFISCSSSYDFLSKNSFYPSDDFSKYLLKEYQQKADFEAIEMHDWNSAKLYSEKALNAVDGITVEPEVISYWKIPKQHHADLEKAYDNLMKVYEVAIKANPYDNLEFQLSEFFQKKEDNDMVKSYLSQLLNDLESS